jgi:hypothetical protein
MDATTPLEFKGLQAKLSAASRDKKKRLETRKKVLAKKTEAATDAAKRRAIRTVRPPDEQVEMRRRRAALIADGAAVPDGFECPITQELMADPVFAADGQSYERAAIERWLAEHNTSPATGAALGNRNVTPNIALRKAIAEWRTQRDATVESKERLGAPYWVQLSLEEKTQCKNIVRRCRAISRRMTISSLPFASAPGVGQDYTLCNSYGDMPYNSSEAGYDYRHWKKKQDDAAGRLVLRKDCRRQKGPAFADLLARLMESGVFDDVRKLFLDGSAIGDAGAEHIARALASGQCTGLISLSLRNNDIGAAGISKLSTALSGGKCGALTALDLSGNRICLGHLATALSSGQCRGLRALGLSNCGLEDRGEDGQAVLPLVAALVSGMCGLRTIDLSHNSADPCEVGAALPTQDELLAAARGRLALARALFARDSSPHVAGMPHHPSGEPLLAQAVGHVLPAQRRCLVAAATARVEAFRSAPRWHACMRVAARRRVDAQCACPTCTAQNARGPAQQSDGSMSLASIGPEPAAAEEAWHPGKRLKRGLRSIKTSIKNQVSSIKYQEVSH